MEKKNGKNLSSGILTGIILCIIIATFSNKRFQWMLRYRPGEVIPMLISLGVTILVVVMVFQLASRRIRGNSEKKEHTHDRIDSVSYDANETEFQHYKKQLDGFLKAGIIEKEEYRLLLRRYQERGY